MVFCSLYDPILLTPWCYFSPLCDATLPYPWFYFVLPMMLLCWLYESTLLTLWCYSALSVSSLYIILILWLVSSFTFFMMMPNLSFKCYYFFSRTFRHIRQKVWHAKSIFLIGQKHLVGNVVSITWLLLFWYQILAESARKPRSVFHVLGKGKTNPRPLSHSTRLHANASPSGFLIIDAVHYLVS